MDKTHLFYSKNTGLHSVTHSIYIYIYLHEGLDIYIYRDSDAHICLHSHVCIYTYIHTYIYIWYIGNENYILYSVYSEKVVTYYI